MDSGLPILNCLLQHTLRNLCTSSSDSSSSSKWVYSIFWRILPRNYPPPIWEHGGSLLDRVKGNKRNWILVWEDGFCDLFACQQAEGKGGFGADIFFKMSHEVYNYGEGLIGKVAADNNHKWIFGDGPNESDPNFIPSWNASIDPQPKAWEAHFNSGIQTIALISVREGIVQLGSFDKIAEDYNLVISIQRKFSYLQSIPGIYAAQRPSIPIQIQYPHAFKPNEIIEGDETGIGIDDKRQLVGSKRLYYDRPDDFTAKSINLGSNSPNDCRSGPSAAVWSIPWTPSYPASTKPSKMPAVLATCNPNGVVDDAMLNQRIGENEGFGVQANGFNGLNELRCGELNADASSILKVGQEDKGGSIGDNVEMENRKVEMGFASQSKGESVLDLN